jgi:hypothetical protein
MNSAQKYNEKMNCFQKMNVKNYYLYSVFLCHAVNDIVF